MNAQYAICIDNTDYERDLELHKVYRVKPDEMGDEAGMLRIIDNTGEDYLYDANRFVAVDLPEAARRSFDQIPA